MLLVARAAELAVVGAAAVVLSRARRPVAPIAPPAAPATPKSTEPPTGDSARPIPAPSFDVRDDQQAADVLKKFLGDVRDALAADEVVLWRWTARRDALTVGASAAVGGEARYAYADEVAPLVEWTARERLLQFGGGELATLAMTAVESGTNVVGVLSVYRAAGFADARESVRRWLPRCGAHVGQLVELLETRDEFLRQSKQREALLSAAHEFQQNRSIEDLGRAICETAARVTGTRRTALVRWIADHETGEVQCTLPTEADLIGLELTAGSHVEQMCATGLPRVWEDASHFDTGTPVFALGERPRKFGSLAIVPLKRGQRVTGAIVIEGDRPGDVRIKDVRNVHLLAAMAAVSLETLWEIEEVTRRARTDQLTGLPNRRAFDEALAAALVQAERYGQPVSLILADIDHFKKVNDTYGHAAGDNVLRSVAATVQRLVRTSDVCARFGGEEIAVLLPQTPQAGAEELAERLRSAIASRTVRAGGREVAVSVSFGVACYRESVAAADGLFAAADRALYRAKADGRNCVRSSAVIAD